MNSALRGGKKVRQELICTASSMATSMAFMTLQLPVTMIEVLRTEREQYTWEKDNK